MINFSAITSSTHSYNFHTHTQFCDGHATIQEFVEEAINRRFKHLGFTPHGPLNVESPCNMSRADVVPFVNEVRRMQAIHASAIHIYAGMEMDFLNTRQFAELTQSTMAAQLDYRIGSVHFIPAFDDTDQYIDIDGRFERFKPKMSLYFHDDIEAVVKSYFNQQMLMVETGGFDIIGHFDKIGLNASLYSAGIDEQPWYDRLVINLLEAILDHGYIIEINTKAWQQHNRFFPNQKYFPLLKKYNAPIIVNSDAHYPALIDSGRPEALQLLKHC